MDLFMENEVLRVCVTTAGAQLKSVFRKDDGTERMWQADPAHWGYHAPILFPYAGKLKDGILTVKGKDYDGSRQHGFARNMEHTPVLCEDSTIVLELRQTEETLALWPFPFRLVSTFTLEGDTLHHTLTVENPGQENLRFGIGYHPAFALPFDEDHTFRDYELRFDRVESPICLDQCGCGLIGKNHYWLGKNIRAIDVDEHLFDHDSHCMTGLSSRTLGLYEKDTGRGVICSIRNFPYVLIWSKPGEPRFVCIEPWNSLPSPIDGGTDWEEKPAAAEVLPGDSWSTTLSMSFI